MSPSLPSSPSTPVESGILVLTLGEVTPLDVMNSVIREMHLSLFDEHKIGDFLFEGYPVPFLSRLEERLKHLDLRLHSPLPFTTNHSFGLLTGRNHSTDTRVFIVNTGVTEDDHAFTVHSWESSNRYPHHITDVF